MERMPSPMRASVVRLELDPKTGGRGGSGWPAAFCHDRLSIWHILFNMLMLYWFGTRLEQMYGSRKFLLFYLTAAVCSSLAYVALALYLEPDAPAIGASGAVMGVMMLYVIFYPNETILLFWLIPVPLWILLSLYVLYDLHPVLLALAGDRLSAGIAHAGTWAGWPSASSTGSGTGGWSRCSSGYRHWPRRGLKAYHGQEPRGEPAILPFAGPTAGRAGRRGVEEDQPAGQG